MGRSYGGYLTLAALVNHPELFAVGIDVCGMADFETFFARTEPWIADAAVGEYGHPIHDRNLLRELSPVHRMEHLRAPLLVIHGKFDTNVPVHEAELAVHGAKAAGVPMKYLLFDDEGHEIQRTENRVRFIHECVDWLGDALRSRTDARVAPGLFEWHLARIVPLPVTLGETSPEVRHEPHRRPPCGARR